MSESDGKNWALEEPRADVLAAPRPPSWSDTEEAYARGLADGITRTLARFKEEANAYRRRAQAIRVEAEVAEAKADALAGAVAKIRREGVP